MKDIIFALDIGTRKVVGLIAQKEKEKLKILEVEVLEHHVRSMLDGQIHNIPEVTKVVRKVKESLEARLKMKLTKVGVAVAGRALRTISAKIGRRISREDEIDKEIIFNLELEAVSHILQGYKAEDFTPVGYNVVYYELDGLKTNSLLRHRGENIAVEVIATFLPRSVLDSLFTVLREVELEVVNLTLEPIAAVNTIIPENMRLLNILLLDIGAGTSDFALTHEGMVVSFSMVPEAGDEITEAVCEKYLLDFNRAEKTKRQLLNHKEVHFTDILGKSQRIASCEVIKEILPRIKQLANSIAKKALELNQTPPQAIVCIGGGSLTPQLPQAIAESLGLNEEKIGIRRPEMVEELQDYTKLISGPDMVTPLGIALMTAKQKGLKFLQFSVNSRSLSLLDIHQKHDIFSCLVATGIEPQLLYGRPGLALSYELNGKVEMIKGELGTPAKIKLNGQVVQLSSQVLDKDEIEFSPAQPGNDAKAFIKDIVEQPFINIQLNGKPYLLIKTILMNGKRVSLEDEVLDRAKIETKEVLSIREVLRNCGYSLEELIERQIVVSVNGTPHILNQRNFTLFLNGQQVGLDAKVLDKATIEFNPHKSHLYRIRDLISKPSKGEDIYIEVNGGELFIPGEEGRILMNEVEVSEDEFLIDGAKITTLVGRNATSFYLSDIFRYYPLNLNEAKNKSLKIFVDGHPAGFTTPLTDKAKVELVFEERPCP